MLGGAHGGCCPGAHKTAVCGFGYIILTKRVPICYALDLHSIIDHISPNGHTGAWERKWCLHKAAQFCKKWPYYRYLLPKQKSGVSFRWLIWHHQDGLPRAESRDCLGDSWYDIDGYGDKSAKKDNDTDEIHDGRHASQLTTTQFIATIGNVRSPERCRFPSRVIVAVQKQTSCL